MLINRFLTICFVLINILIFGASCAQKVVQGEKLYSNPTYKIANFSFPDSQSIYLKTAISIKEAQISGITIAKFQGDTITGVFMNEFGVKGFEFMTYNGNCKLMNVMSKLDKWYIKKTLSEDFAFIFLVQNSEIRPFGAENLEASVKCFKKCENTQRFFKKEITGEINCNKDTVTMKNLKRNITYTFTQINK